MTMRLCTLLVAAMLATWTTAMPINSIDALTHDQIQIDQELSAFQPVDYHNSASNIEDNETAESPLPFAEASMIERTDTPRAGFTAQMFSPLILEREPSINPLLSPVDGRCLEGSWRSCSTAIFMELTHIIFAPSRERYEQSISSKAPNEMETYIYAPIPKAQKLEAISKAIKQWHASSMEFRNKYDLEYVEFSRKMKKESAELVPLYENVAKAKNDILVAYQTQPHPMDGSDSLNPRLQPHDVQGWNAVGDELDSVKYDDAIFFKTKEFNSASAEASDRYREAAYSKRDAFNKAKLLLITAAEPVKEYSRIMIEISEEVQRLEALKVRIENQVDDPCVEYAEHYGCKVTYNFATREHLVDQSAYEEQENEMHDSSWDDGVVI